MPTSNPILIVHGWGSNYQSFIPLKTSLQTQGYQAEQVFFANYESMEDHVTFDDLAAGLQRRLEELVAQNKLPAGLAPFSLDVIVHSTGGPVIRHWLSYYLKDKCRGDLARCPIRCLIMLAPANFGSRLAAQGKSTLAKLFRGGMAHGFQTGAKILTGLELGSPDLWRMAQQDLFGSQAIYPCQADRGPFVFVFSGTATFGSLKGFVAPGANEDGSDGTIRAAAASLNSIKLSIDYHNPAHPEVQALRQPNAPFAFRLVPGVNHSEIYPSAPVNPAHRILALIPRCLAVENAAQYEELRLAFDQETEEFYKQQKLQSQALQIHRYQQFIVHLRDEMGNDVPDYRLDLHVVDRTIRFSAWDPHDPTTLQGLQAYQPYTTFLQEHVIANVEPHSVNASYRTFFLNLDRLNDLQAQLKGDSRQPYIAMNLDALGATSDLTYATDGLHYLPMEYPIQDSKGGQAEYFKSNTSTLVEIVLQSVPTRNVMNVISS